MAHFSSEGVDLHTHARPMVRGTLMCCPTNAKSNEEGLHQADALIKSLQSLLQGVLEGRPQVQRSGFGPRIPQPVLWYVGVAPSV